MTDPSLCSTVKQILIQSADLVPNFFCQEKSSSGGFNETQLGWRLWGTMFSKVLIIILV